MVETFFTCYRCDTATVHKLLASAESDYRYCDADGYFGYEPATYHFFQCIGCRSVSINAASAFHSPDSRFGERTYPSSPAGEPHIPPEVRRAYYEAERIKHHSYAAYAVLGRKLLELIASDQGIKQRNLAQAMSLLAAQGKIPPMLSEAGTLIRTFGNSSAHGTEKLNALHVQLIEKFLEVTIQYLYVAPGELNELKALLEIDEQGASAGAARPGN